MTEINTDEIMGILRKLAKIMASDKGYSEIDITKAKSIATKLYISHSRREISLSSEEFNLVLDIIQFDPNSVN